MNKRKFLKIISLMVIFSFFTTNSSAYIVGYDPWGSSKAYLQYDSELKLFYLNGKCKSIFFIRPEDIPANPDDVIVDIRKYSSIPVITNIFRVRHNNIATNLDAISHDIQQQNAVAIYDPISILIKIKKKLLGIYFINRDMDLHIVYSVLDKEWYSIWLDENKNLRIFNSCDKEIESSNLNEELFRKLTPKGIEKSIEDYFVISRVKSVSFNSPTLIGGKDIIHAEPFLLAFLGVMFLSAIFYKIIFPPPQKEEQENKKHRFEIPFLKKFPSTLAGDPAQTSGSTQASDSAKTSSSTQANDSTQQDSSSSKNEVDRK